MGLSVPPITTTVINTGITLGVGTGCFGTPVGSVGIDRDERPPASILLLDRVFPKAIKKVHDTGDSLRVRALALLGGDHTLDARLSITRPAGAFSA